MKAFELIFTNGHILFDNGDGLVLVDSGSPASFHETGMMKVGDDSFEVPTSLMGVTSRYVSQNVGSEVRGLLGMDYIGRHATLIDIVGGRIVFDAETDGYAEVASFFAGCSGLVLNVGGREARVFLDTGAPISYLSHSFTDGEKSWGKKEDFSPFSSAGRFETDIYYLDTVFAGEQFRMQVGNLPSDMGMMLKVFGVDGVVGLEILKRTSVIFADGKVLVPIKG